MELIVTPFPNPDTTPPVTTMYFIVILGIVLLLLELGTVNEMDPDPRSCEGCGPNV